MSIIGNTDLWSEFFPDHLIPEIIDLVISTWNQFPKPAVTELEVPITRQLCNRLRQNRKLRKLPVRISREEPEDDLSTGKEIGRIDLRFCAGYLEEVYFAFECKRLNVKWQGGVATLASKYVAEGMMRFITSQYATGLLYGGMIGYVMDGKTADAINAVDSSVKKQYKKLCINPPAGLCSSTIRPTDEETKETNHHINNYVFTIHHVFLSI